MYPIIFCAPHAKSTIDDKELRQRFCLTDYEIWKCSDPFTDNLDEFTCAHKKHIAQVHRLVCDFNRAPSTEDAFRDRDFFGRKVFHEGAEYSESEKKEFLQKHWHPFHDEILKSIRELDKETSDPILIIDYHNTSGDHPLGGGKSYMPSLVVSNLGKSNNGAKKNKGSLVSIPGKYLQRFKQEVTSQIPLWIEINGVYCGGYDTKWISELRSELKLESKLYCFQIEYNLDFIANPLSKKIDHDALHILQKALNEAIVAVYEDLKHLQKNSNLLVSLDGIV